MGKHIHFIVSKWRSGWSVNVEADRVSDHTDLAKALAAAEVLGDLARSQGDRASTVDLTDGDPDAADPKRADPD